MKKSKNLITKLNLNYKLIGYFVSFGLLVLFCGCTKKETSINILHKTKEKIKNHTLMTYNYESFWDNRFNDSEFRDTSYLELERSDKNLHGLLFYFSDTTHIDYFDGEVHKSIDHKESRIINDDREEFSIDSTYFLNMMFLMAQPTHFLDIDSTYEKRNSKIRDRNALVYSTSKESESDSDKLNFVTEYGIDKQSNKPWFIKTISIKNKDTTQVITHYFQDIKFSNKSIDFENIRDYALEFGYIEMTSQQFMANTEEDQVQTGTKLMKSKYENIFEEETSIFGRNGKRTVLMFSFIGCGGCEYAMKEMKKKKFDFKEDVDFYYSSPLDKSTVLRTYLSNKGFDGIGFGEESKMNENFKAFRYPTFFILDSIGTVTDIYHGYRNGFENEIF